LFHFTVLVHVLRNLVRPTLFYYFARGSGSEVTTEG